MAVDTGEKPKTRAASTYVPYDAMLTRFAYYCGSWVPKSSLQEQSADYERSCAQMREKRKWHQSPAARRRRKRQNRR